MNFKDKLAKFKSKLDNLDDFSNQIEDIAKLVKYCLEKNRVYIIGNGGSAADSQHFAAEIIVRFKKNRSPLPAIALTTDSSILTAISNDYSFDEVFSRQLKGLLKENDILFSFSTSGESKNILNAVNYANSIDATTISLTGNSKNTLSEISKNCISCPSNETDEIQTMHQIIYHYICEKIEM